MRLLRVISRHKSILNHWIAQSRKMVYKINFRPMEGLIDDRWQLLPLP